MSSRRAFSLLASICCVAACSSDPASPATNKDSGTADVAPDTKVTTDAPEVCTAETVDTPTACADPPGAAGTQCVKTVTGKVVDPSGAPIGCKLVSICGEVCFFGKTNPDGTFTTKVGQYIAVADFSASVHGRPEFASLYEKLPITTAENIALPNNLVLPRMPATGMKIPMNDMRVVTAATTVTDGDLTLAFEASTELELDIEDVELVTLGLPGDHFRAVKVEEANYPSFAKGANVKALYALSPFDLKFINKKVPLTINNTAGLAEGAAVEIVGLGNEFLRAPFTAGKLEVVAAGKVTGGKIVTDAGEGLKTLTWIGVRAK